MTIKALVLLHECNMMIHLLEKRQNVSPMGTKLSSEHTTTVNEYLYIVSTTSKDEELRTYVVQDVIR